MNFIYSYPIYTHNFFLNDYFSKNRQLKKKNMEDRISHGRGNSIKNSINIDNLHMKLF